MSRGSFRKGLVELNVVERGRKFRLIVGFGSLWVMGKIVYLVSIEIKLEFF